jgi:ribose transport system ATP-binding protein
MRRICKNFGATRALHRVDLEVLPGDVHALIGENGAGKSTLMKVLSGAIKPDGGTMQLDGASYLPEGPLGARRAGVGMIYQELNLAEHLSVMENVCLGIEPVRAGFIEWDTMRQRVHRALSELEHGEIDPRSRVNRLSLAAKQVVEVARALVMEARVIVFDEPTSSLSQADTERLFRVIERLKERGTSVVYISHFLEEVQRIADRFTVLRDGETMGSGVMRETSLGEIIALMVGRDLKEMFPRVPHEMGEPVLDLSGLAGRELPRDVSLTLHRGEILGLAGLVGAGRTETVRAVFGLEPVRKGEVKIGTLPTTGFTAARMLEQGVGMLSEDRKSEGLALSMSLADNITLGRLPSIVTPQRQHRESKAWLERLKVRARGPGARVDSLSGGNQQKIAVARLLHSEVDVLLLDEPTRGIDVGTKAEIYQLIGELAAQGKAVLFVSSYLPELLGVCDTLAVMRRGTLTDLRPGSDWTEMGVMTAATGGGPSEAEG